MMGLRTTLVTVLAVLAATGAHAQGMRTATGNNPLERVSGADYGGNGSLGRLEPAPSYTARYGLYDVNGGAGGAGFNYSPQLNGNGIDPRTGVSIVDNQNNPFLYPYTRSPGGQVGGQVGGVAASGIYAGVGGGAYYTPNAGSYYQGGGVNPGLSSLAYGGGYNYLGAGYGYNGMGMSNGAYPFGISSSGLNSTLTNPMLSSYGNMGNAYANYGGLGYGGYGYGGVGGYGSAYGYGSPYGYGYSAMRNIVPGLVGGAVGALVGRHFGVVGLIAGGVGGFLVGSFLGNQARQMPFSGLYDNYNAMQDTWYGNQMSYYHGLYGYYGNRPNSNLGPLPGVAGAVVGALIGKMGGLPGMLIGGVVGFVGGQLLSSVMFPQNQYNNGYYSYDPYNNINNARSATLPGAMGSTPATSGASATVTPAAPVADDRLGALREAYFKAVTGLQTAASSGDEGAKKQAEATLKSAEEAYRNAQRAAGQ